MGFLSVVAVHTLVPAFNFNWHSLSFKATNTPEDGSRSWRRLKSSWHMCHLQLLPRSDSAALILRCHSQHEASSITYGGDGVEANPAAPHHHPWYLPAASRKSLHLEKRVPGCDGEVSEGVRGWGGEGEGKRRGLKIINGSLFRNLSLISTWSWGNTAARPRRRQGVSESLNIGSAVLHT